MRRVRTATSFLGLFIAGSLLSRGSMSNGGLRIQGGVDCGNLDDVRDGCSLFGLVVDEIDGASLASQSRSGTIIP